MQIGKYYFTVEPNNCVFIEVAGDGEGIYSNISDLPKSTQKLLESPKTVAALTVEGHAAADVAMDAFWKKQWAQ